MERSAADRAGTDRTIRLDGIAKAYGARTVVDVPELAIEAGEFLTLLGPSGCGKTTLLLMLAGFVRPTRGAISVGSQDITARPPEKRNFGMVFQGYALFPHLSVANNVAYPLRRRGIGGDMLSRSVKDVLAKVQLSEFADQLPKQLSGGQQQRVALARSIVFEPDLVLLDEPLSALDTNLRHELRLQLKSIHRELGTTFICVTHDQDEALSMSDRIAVMRNGQIVQLATPQELYNRPKTRFVAGFMGAKNLIALGAVRRRRGPVPAERRRPAGRHGRAAAAGHAPIRPHGRTGGLGERGERHHPRAALLRIGGRHHAELADGHADRRAPGRPHRRALRDRRRDHRRLESRCAGRRRRCVTREY
jgi:putative spermidine/putrescine transport system ATP-binding protein